jgi:hypothetical protein
MGAAKPDEQGTFDTVSASHHELDDAESRRLALERTCDLRRAKPRWPVSALPVFRPLASLRELDDDPAWW